MALSRGDVISLGKFAEKLERVSQRHALLNSSIDMIPLSCPGLMKPLKTQILCIPLYLLHVQTKGLLGAHLNILVSFFSEEAKNPFFICNHVGNCHISSMTFTLQLRLLCEALDICKEHTNIIISHYPHRNLVSVSCYQCR